MLRAALGLGLALALSGCLSVPAFDRALVVTVEDSFRIVPLSGGPSQDARVEGDTGSHCAPAWVDGSTVRWLRDGRAPDGLVVRRFVTDSRPGDALLQSWGGDAVAVEGFDPASGRVGLRSPAKAGPVVANVTAEDDDVRVEGEVLEKGARRTLTREYAFEDGGVRYQVFSNLTFENHGRLHVVKQLIAGGCM